jgi:hypothetical protein
LNECYKDDLTAQPGGPSFNESCRSVVEHIVVSDPQTASVKTEDQEFAFTFSRALPLAATDVQLQVVYRGVLGNEADAVVVATKDISEPTFFEYHNSTDYISFPPHVYTRAEVNANVDGTLDRVMPRSCVNATVSPARLAEYCFRADDLDVGAIFGTPGATSALNFRVSLPALEYLRVAFLADRATATSISQFDSNDCVVHDPFVVGSVAWQKTYDPLTQSYSNEHSLFKTIRGIYGWYQWDCVWLGDGIAAERPDDRRVRMTALPAGKRPYALPPMSF